MEYLVEVGEEGEEKSPYQTGACLLTFWSSCLLDEVVPLGALEEETKEE